MHDIFHIYSPALFLLLINIFNQCPFMTKQVKYQKRKNRFIMKLDIRFEKDIFIFQAKQVQTKIYNQIKFQMMEQKQLSDALATVLKLNKRTQCFTSKMIMNNLLQYIEDDQKNCLQKFTCYLEKELSMQPIEIFQLIQTLMINPETNDLLGAKVKNCLALFKIYKQEGIIQNKLESEQKRKQIQQLFEKCLSVVFNINSNINLPGQVEIDFYCSHFSNFIYENIEEQLLKFEKMVIEIANKNQSQDLQVRLPESKNKITQSIKLFNKLNWIQVAVKMQKIIQNNRNTLINELFNSSQVQKETIRAIKFFSKLIDDNLENQIVQIMTEKFNLVFDILVNQIDQGNFHLLQQNLNILINLTKTSSKISQGQIHQIFSSKLKQLYTSLRLYIMQPLEVLSICEQEDQILAEQIVINENIKIQNIFCLFGSDIISDFLNHFVQLKRLRQFASIRLQQIKKNLFNLLEWMKQIRVFTQNGEINDEFDFIQLRQRKKKIDLLMKIQFMRQDYQSEYMNTANILLINNAEILKNHIVALKEIKDEQIYTKLEIIKNEVLIAKQYCSIMNNFDQSQKSLIQIQSEYAKFLIGELKLMRRQIIVKNNQIKQNTFRKIQIFYNKIEIYSKMQGIGSQIKDLVDKIKNQFQLKLQQPLIEFKQKILKHSLNQFIFFYKSNIIKFQEYSMYVRRIKLIVPEDYYEKIFQKESNIRQILENFCTKVNDYIKQANQLDYQNYEEHTYLKNLITILLKMRLYENSMNYLRDNLSFQLDQKIEIIQDKLDLIADKMNRQIKICNNLQQLEELIKSYNFFIDIQQIFSQNGPKRKGFQKLWQTIRRREQSIKNQTKSRQFENISIVKQNNAQQSYLFFDINNSLINGKQLSKQQQMNNQFNIQAQQIFLQKMQRQQGDEKQIQKYQNVSFQNSQMLIINSSKSRSDINKSVIWSSYNIEQNCKYTSNKCQVDSLKHFYFQKCKLILESLSKKSNRYLPEYKDIQLQHTKNQSILRFTMQKGHVAFSEYGKYKNEDQYIDYLIRNNMFLDWMISIAMSIDALQKLGILHADIQIRNSLQWINHIKNDGHIRFVFKLIDYDYAFQVKDVQGGQKGYKLTKEMIRTMINADQSEQQKAISHIYYTHHDYNEQGQKTIEKIKSIIKQNSGEESIQTMMKFLQQHSHKSHLEQFIVAIKKIMKNQRLERLQRKIYKRIQLQIKWLQLSQEPNRYQKFQQELIKIKKDMKTK